MINEGGIGIQDAFFDGQTVYAISVAEKGVLWLKMIASGEPGHGSTPMPDEAPTRLLAAIGRLAERPVDPIWNPATYELLFNIGETRSGLERAALTHPASVRSLLKGRLMGIPATAAMITNTVHVTGLEGANQPNVVPSEVAAILDCRLQPDTDPGVLLAELEAMYVDEPWIRFEVIHQLAGNGSPWDDPFYAALVRHLEEQDPSGVAGPIVSVGFTDSIVFRPLGVRAYGIAPFSVPADELVTMHGHGERVSLENLQRGLRVVFGAVVDVSAADGGSPPAEPMGVPVRPEPVPEREPPTEPVEVEAAP
jgi:acetylornithine deacetylase/succinyl-diaminopimelate desuccinylase-like protein